MQRCRQISNDVDGPTQHAAQLTFMLYTELDAECDHQVMVFNQLLTALGQCYATYLQSILTKAYST